MAKTVFKAGKIGISVIIPILLTTILINSLNHRATARQSQEVDPAVANIETAGIVIESTEPNTPEAVIKLLNFNPDPDVIKQACKIADLCRDAGKNALARQIYSGILEKSDKSPLAMHSLSALAVMDIYEDDPNSADSLLLVLLDDYPDQKNVTEAVLQIAETYFIKSFHKNNTGNTDESELYLNKALAICHRIIEEINEDTGTLASVNILAGECYRAKGLYNAAIIHYEETISRWPESGDAFKAGLPLANCLERLSKEGRISRQQADNLIRAIKEKFSQKNHEQRQSKSMQNNSERKSQNQGGVK